MDTRAYIIATKGLFHHEQKAMGSRKENKLEKMGGASFTEISSSMLYVLEVQERHWFRSR
jgi:hypothetical protein